jgi:predicted unusual protein kinase regulating ubiquinone biosynthesis (AarF/ABC1/UbiB family)
MEKFDDFSQKWHATHCRRHHGTSARLLYRTVIRDQGLLIKTMQFLSSRPVDVLSHLQDEVPPEPFSGIRPAIERELHALLTDIFREFDPHSDAAASLAQVLRAGQGAVSPASRSWSQEPRALRAHPQPPR